MKDKRVVFWKIQCVDRTTEVLEDVTAYTAGGERIEKCWRKKRFERSLYLCSSDLSEEDNIYVDIALQYQNNFNQPHLFFMIKNLFHEGDWMSIPDVTQYQSVFAPGYFEDQTGQGFNKNQFMETVCGLSPQIETRARLHVPANLPTDTAKSLGVPELVPIRQEDFNLPSKHYALLNRFVEDCWKFSISPFIRENPPFQVGLVSDGLKLIPLISPTQLKSSLMDFRKLYMMDEPANFIKAMGVLSDKRVAFHPICKYVSTLKKEFLSLKTQKITNSFILKNFPGINGQFNPTYKDIINIMFNTEYFHQGNNIETIDFQKKVFNALTDNELRLIAFYFAIYDISSVFLKACSYVEHILVNLEKLTASRPPLPEPREREKLFRIDLLKHKYRLAETIWHESNLQGTRPSDFLSEAQNRLMKKFSFTEDYFL